MVFRKGDVVLIPFPYTGLSTAKARPPVVVSSEPYHRVNQEILVAYVTSQLSQADPWLDYQLQDWRTAGLLRPSLVKPRLAAIDPSLVRYRVGLLTAYDLMEVDRRLRRAMALLDTVLEDVLAEVDLSGQSAATVQALAEKAVAAVADFAAKGDPAAVPDCLRALLPVV